jgi:hypothetical protein
LFSITVTSNFSSAFNPKVDTAATVLFWVFCLRFVLLLLCYSSQNPLATFNQSKNLFLSSPKVTRKVGSSWQCPSLSSRTPRKKFRYSN